MLERIQDAPAQTLALKASGTIMAQDVEAAIQAALGSSNAASGLVIVIDRDFDGYLAELARGLANAALAHRSLVKLAVVTDADRMEEAKLSGFDVSAVPIRLFATADRNLAFGWAAGARRGE
jgi:glucose-6-phosphate dehydrogenase assembly protein OpcA